MPSVTCGTASLRAWVADLVQRTHECQDLGYERLALDLLLFMGLAGAPAQVIGSSLSSGSGALLCLSEIYETETAFIEPGAAVATDQRPASVASTDLRTSRRYTSLSLASGYRLRGTGAHMALRTRRTPDQTGPSAVLHSRDLGARWETIVVHSKYPGASAPSLHLAAPGARHLRR